MKKLFRYVLLVLPLLWLVAGCGGGQKARKAESAVDSPSIHYERGKTLLKSGKGDQALFEFKQATSLDPGFAPAYEGMAWVYLEKGDLEQARKMAEKSLDLDGKWILAKLVQARIKAQTGKYEDAIKETKKVLKSIPSSSVPDKQAATIEAYLTLGKLYQLNNQYNQAQEAYAEVLNIDRTNREADRAIRELAAYQTAVAGQRPEIRKIAGQQSITRADVAVLLVLELPLKKIFRSAPSAQQAAWKPPTTGVMGKKTVPEPPGTPKDVPADYWARSFISEVLETGVMELTPEGKFNPDAPVNRAEFARIIEKFLARYWNDSSLETRFFGQTSPFRDVINTSPIFNAIMTVSTRGIMTGFEDGTFRPLEPVSGTEAINIVRRLKNQL